MGALYLVQWDGEEDDVTTKRADELKVGDVVLAAMGRLVIRSIFTKFGLLFFSCDLVYDNANDAGRDDKNWFFKAKGVPAFLPAEFVEVLTP